MDAEDIISLSACDSDNESGKDEGKRLSHEVGVEGRGPGGIVVGESVDETEVEEGQLISEREVGVVADSSYMSERVGTSILDHLPSRGENGCVNYDNEVEEGQLIPEMDSGIVSLSTLHEHIGVTERVTESEVKAVDVPSENGCMTEHPERDGCSALSGVKRTRATFEEQHPSVHVKYYGLSRQSKQKLEELLREWSEWNARSSSRAQDENGSSETGEEIYFPALDIGTGKTSAVTFWMENEIRKPENEEFNPVEDASVPLYDRGFALGLISADGSSNLEGGSELLDAPRCFNCGSYGHSLKECQKPRDNVAVNNSRKQLKSKRNQTAGMRNLTRYYQDSPGGKYEGLRPGVLDAETRRLLGLEETDPPPWLNRMREIGYPPGYLEPEDENLPSGITIYADEEIKEDKEDGEILEAEVAEVARKMSVKFPGMNAPIPKSADERVWAARPSNSGRHRNGDGGRPNHISEHNSRGRYREYNNRELKDEDPLGFDRASRYISRYDDNEFSSTSHNLRENAPTARSPRSLGDRGRNDPMDSEDSEAYRSYSSFSYNSSRRFLEHSNGLDFSRGDHSDYSSRSRERDDRHRRR